VLTKKKKKDEGMKKGEKGKRKRMKQEELHELSDNVCHIISNESIYIHRVF